MDDEIKRIDTSERELAISLRVKIKNNFPIFTKVMLLSSKQFNVHVQCITESHSGRNTTYNI